MFEPDFRLSDDQDAYLDVYEAYWAHWRGVFRQPAGSSSAFDRHLYVFTYEQESADQDELFAGFESEHRQFARCVYRGADPDQHHFGVVYLDKRSGRRSILAWVLIHPMFAGAFIATAARWKRRRSGLAIAMFAADMIDPDAHWRMIATGVGRTANSPHSSQQRMIVLGPAYRSAA